jgi:hypothetical protein
MAKNILNPDLRIIWRGKEAQGAISKADFFNKINISLKEMRESNYPLTSSPRRAGSEYSVK